MIIEFQSDLLLQNTFCILYSPHDWTRAHQYDACICPSNLRTRFFRLQAFFLAFENKTCLHPPYWRPSGSLGPVRFSKMATTAEICPSVETLTNFETAVPCPAQGCTKVFPSTSSLRMHVVKTHNMATCIEEKQVFVRGATKAQVSKHFYCPVEFCPRGKDSKRPFPRLGQLKQVKSIDRLRQTDR